LIAENRAIFYLGKSSMTQADIRGIYDPKAIQRHIRGVQQAWSTNPFYKKYRPANHLCEANFS
jgi:hypothetical protein